MIGLLRLLREHPDAVEADLSRYHQIDYRDRWRFDEHGRKLTLRMIWARIRYLPRDAATVVTLEGSVPWSREEELLDEIRLRLEALGGVKKPKPQPGRQRLQTKPRTPDRERRLRRARARARERRRRIEAGEIT